VVLFEACYEEAHYPQDGSFDAVPQVDGANKSGMVEGCGGIDRWVGLAVKYIIPLLIPFPCRCSLDWFLDNKEHDGQSGVDWFCVVMGEGEVLEAAEDGVSDDWSTEAMDARCDDALSFKNRAFFRF